MVCVNSAYRFSDSNKPAAIFLMGPTASGKTALAVELAAALPCEIVSVDSALVYRGMDIGTAKPSPAELEQTPHKLIDIRDPVESYSAADFRSDALREMKEITARGNIPLLVGGTMLYFKALRDGLAVLPSADSIIRAKLKAEAEAFGWKHLHQRLADIDPESALRIHVNDTQRLQRAVEVYEITGKTLTQLRGEQISGVGLDSSIVQLNELYNVRAVAIAPKDRSVLHQRIAERFDEMLTLGFVEEVRQLYEDEKITADLPAMRAVGYRQVWSYLNGELSYEDMKERGTIATRQLAKRQFTWLRAWEGLSWFDSCEHDLLPHVMKMLAVLRKFD